MRMLKLLLFVFFLFPAVAWSWGTVITSGTVESYDFCSSQTWNTLTNFRLDFDHPDNNLEACLTSGTEIGTLTSGATIETPTPESPGSMFMAISANGDNEYVLFDNTNSYFNSKWGHLLIKVMLENDNTNDCVVFDAEGVPYEDMFQLRLDSNGVLFVLWEDNNNGAITVYSASGGSVYDFDNHYGDWAQIEAMWDTTRCTDGTCDGAGEGEIKIRIRFDDNNDGDFDDGDSENWSSWKEEVSAIDLNTWSVEPGEDDIKIGLVGTHTADCYIDDIEISADQPSW